MRPTKNKFYCANSQRPKMLFKTREKADRFILFNGEEVERINGFAPKRSYYCKSCRGYHLTSMRLEDYKSGSFEHQKNKRVGGRKRRVQKMRNQLRNAQKYIQLMEELPKNSQRFEQYSRAAARELSQAYGFSECTKIRRKLRKKLERLCPEKINLYALAS